MTISELIEALEEIMEERGDLEVRVQYRDAGGEYEGTGEVYEPCDEWIEWYKSEVSTGRKRVVVL